MSQPGVSPCSPHRGQPSAPCSSPRRGRAGRRGALSGALCRGCCCGAAWPPPGAPARPRVLRPPTMTTSCIKNSSPGAIHAHQKKGENWSLEGLSVWAGRFAPSGASSERVQVPLSHAAGASYQQHHRFQPDKTHQSSLLNKATSPALSPSQSGSDASHQTGPNPQRKLRYLGAGLSSCGQRGSCGSCCRQAPLGSVCNAALETSSPRAAAALPLPLCRSDC